MSSDIDDQRIRTLLRGVDGPSAPPPGLEARIRAEMALDRASDEVMLGNKVARRPPARSGVLIAAALVLAVAIATAVLLAMTGTDGRVGTDLGDGSQLRRRTEADARAACDRFAATAFGARSRAEVIGPTNADHLGSTEETRDAAATLRAALVATTDDLQDIGVSDAALERHVQRALATLDHAIDMSDRGLLRAAQAELVQVRTPLLGAEQDLTRLGVPRCL